MAVTFGQLAARILRDTARDVSFQDAVEDAIISAIKELEREEYWLFETNATLTLAANADTVALPDDFVALSTARLLVGTTYYNEVYGFMPVTNHEIFNYPPIQNQIGVPFMYAIYANNMVVYPAASAEYTIDIHYFHKDESYPVNYDDTSIWLGDLTSDLTRYKAMAMFYRDTLQAEEKAQFYEAKSMDSITNLRIRNNQRRTINRLSI